MKHISLHLPTTPLHSPSKPKSKIDSPPPIDVALLPVPAAGMQVKGVRTIVRRFRGAIQIVARSHHHQSPAIAALVPAPPPPPTATAPDPFEAFVPPVVAVDLDLSPKHSSDSLASSSHSTSSSHLTQPAERHRSSSTFSSSPSSIFGTAVDHSSSCDASLEVQPSMSGDASSYTSALPEGQSIDLSDLSHGSTQDASTVASSEHIARPTQYPEHEEEDEQTQDEDEDEDEVTPQRADSSAPGDDERSSTLDEPQFGTSEQPADSTEFAAASPVSQEPTEPEAPDPFLEDVSEESDTSEVPPNESAEPAGGLSVDETAQSLAAAEEVALAQSPPPTWPTDVPNTSIDLNKAVPPPPPPAAEDDDEDEEDSPELYLPGLVLPTMFLPIPNVGSSSFYTLTWWLPGRHVYYPCTIRRTH